MINPPPNFIYMRIDRKKPGGGYPHFDSVSTTTKRSTFEGWVRDSNRDGRTTFRIGEIDWTEEIHHVEASALDSRHRVAGR